MKEYFTGNNIELIRVKLANCTEGYRENVGVGKKISEISKTYN